jgi:uncharacterized protein YneF (UPF0154 family)
MTVKELIKHLQKHHNEDQRIAAVIWTDKDVISVATDMGVELSEEKIDEVLESLRNNHNAEFGITWDTIEDAIDFATEDAPI